jgi:hypothetical protein
LIPFIPFESSEALKFVAYLIALYQTKIIFSFWFLGGAFLSFHFRAKNCMVFGIFELSFFKVTSVSLLETSCSFL